MFLLFLEVTTSKEEDEDDEAFSPSLLSTKIALNVLDRRGKTSSSPPFSLSFLVFFLKAKFACVLRIPLSLKEDDEDAEKTLHIFVFHFLFLASILHQREDGASKIKKKTLKKKSDDEKNAPTKKRGQRRRPSSLFFFFKVFFFFFSSYLCFNVFSSFFFCNEEKTRRDTRLWCFFWLFCFFFFFFKELTKKCWCFGIKSSSSSPG